VNFFPVVHQWKLPGELLPVSLQEMALDGRVGNEGICLWLGQRGEDGIAVVSHAVKLRGCGIWKSPVNIRIAPELMREVHQYARALGVILVGQIHSHGPYHSVDLSPTDLRYGVSVPYYLSLVAPDYSLRAETQWRDCGVHIFAPGSGYRRVCDNQIPELLLVDSALPLQEVTIDSR
jgi:proteasome lid subunit RPN8/RPN11